MLGAVLEGLEKSEVFFDISSDSEIIDTGVLQDVMIVDEECTSQGKTCIIEDSVVGCNLFFNICDQRDIDGS